MRADVFRRAAGIRGPDGLVGFLGAPAGAVGAGLGGELLGAEATGDVLTRGLFGAGGDAHGVGTHIRY